MDTEEIQVIGNFEDCWGNELLAMARTDTIRGHMHQFPMLPTSLKPNRIIFNNKTTICIWEDDTRTIVRTSKGEKFVKEYGVAMCIVKKLYGSRSAFLRQVEAGYSQEK